jgi:serine protease Do
MAQQQNMTGVSFADLVDKLMPGVVNISTTRSVSGEVDNFGIESGNNYIHDYFVQDEGGRTSLGSGFLIDAKGYIVTNNHVIEGADEIAVRLSDDRQFQATIVGHDKKTDLALIKIDSPDPLPFVKLGDSDTLRVGDWILAIGNPFGLGGSVTAGIVSAKSRDIDAGSYDNFIQTDAAINQGSSGGPLFNMNGEVVGINTAIFSSNGGSMGIGFATPVNLSKFVIEQLIQKGVVERGWLGLKVTNNTEDIVLSDNQTFKGGVVVSFLTEDAPAAKAGIEAGDVIIAFNGNDVKDAKSFSRSVAETPIGQSVILRVWRNNEIKDLTLTIAQMPEDKPQGSLQADEPTIQSSVYVEDLGVRIEENGNQIKVSEVSSNSKAASQGIQNGDIIQKIDGKDISSADDVQSYMAYAKTAGGPPVEIRILRDGLPQTLQVKVQE